MTAAPATTERRPPPPAVRRALALARFAGRGVASGWAWRVAGIYAWAAAAGYLALAALWTARGESVAPWAVVSRALIWISWAGGVATWAAARAVEEEEARLGLTALASLRGASPSALLSAHVVATALLVARVVFLPAFALSVAVAFIARSPIALVETAPGVFVYAALFGATFGGLARIAARLNPRHGRAVFVALVLGPELLRSAFEDVPSLVSAFGALIDALLGFGGTSA